MRGLSKNQKRFVKEYLLDLNATQAAIRSGYSKKTAKSSGQRLLTYVDVQEAIQKGKAERERRTEITADYVLIRLVEIDQMDCIDILNDNGTVKPISEWPKIWRQYLSGLDISEIYDGQGDERRPAGLLKKIKWPDKLKNLELLGRHVNVQAFKDKVEVEANAALLDRIERALSHG